MGIVVSFDLEARDALLLYFFAAIGLSTDARTLRHGGRPLLILSGLAIGFMVLQNLAGMETARAFGLDPRAGLMVGSISLTGGVGTTLAWSDLLR
jgi:ESS family glutamate:Na+ symporter